MADCLIGLGSNLGDRLATLEMAVNQLRSHPATTAIEVSRWCATPPIGGPSGQGEFLNGAVRLHTSLSPEALHLELQRIEMLLGRTRNDRWAARTLDLDLLLYDDLVLETDQLTIPHPNMAFRRFVLVPAAEVAPEMLHPRLGWRVEQLLAHLDTALPYVAVTGLPQTGKTVLVERLSQQLGAAVVYDPGPVPLEPAATNPAGLNWLAAIELLRSRTELLSGIATSSDPALKISDFWFGQSLAYAKGDLEPIARGAFFQEWEAARRVVPACKLLVVVDVESGPWYAGRRVVDPIHQLPLTVERLDALQAALVDLAHGPGQGPVLHVDALQPDQALNEVVAAIESMQ